MRTNGVSNLYNFRILDGNGIKIEMNGNVIVMNLLFTPDDNHDEVFENISK